MSNFAQFDFVPLLLAVLLGGLVGLEREMHGRPAGLRTHALVCVCSTMLILVARQGEIPTSERHVFDPNRMGAGIVTGIGFLGAATVLRSGDLLRGLTTAACIWFVAGLGIVLGNKDYALAIVGTLFVLSVLTYFERASGLIRPTIYRRLSVSAERGEVEPLIEEIKTLLEAEKVRVIDIHGGTSRSGPLSITVYLSTRDRFQGPRLTERVCALEGVKEARWKGIRTD